jgi:hypothetical protein
MMNFDDAIQEAEIDQVSEFIEASGVDGDTYSILMALHFGAKVDGRHTESGLPMRAIDWYQLHGHSIGSYVNYLQRKMRGLDVPPATKP